MKSTHSALLNHLYCSSILMFWHDWPWLLLWLGHLLCPKNWVNPYWSYKFLNGICFLSSPLFTQAWNTPSLVPLILNMAFIMCNFYHLPMHNSCIIQVSPAPTSHSGIISLLYPHTVWGTAEWWTIRSLNLQPPAVLLLRWSLVDLNPYGLFSYLKINVGYQMASTSRRLLFHSHWKTNSVEGSMF